MPSGQRVVLDSHRLLLPDLAWIRWMHVCDEARPRVWAVSITSGDCCEYNGETLPAFDFRACSDSSVGWPGENEEGMASLCNAVKYWSQSRGVDPLIETVSAAFENPYHRGAGCILLDGSGRDGKIRWVFVVASASWYFGKTPQLTCMLPAEAASHLVTLSGPKLSPDVTLMQGYDAGDTKQKELFKAASHLASTERLASALLSIRAAVESLKLPTSSEWDADIPRGSWSRARAACKEVLHSHGLGLRHIG